MELLYDFEPEDEANNLFGIDAKKDLEYLISQINEVDNTIDLDVIRKAFCFAYEQHQGKFRKSGKPYYTHPLSVALVLLKEFSIHDTASLAACLCIDSIICVHNHCHCNLSSKSACQSSIISAFTNSNLEMVVGLSPYIVSYSFSW